MLLLGKHVKDTVAKAFEVLIPISVSLEDFDLVVAAFGEAVSDRRIERIDIAGIPVAQSLSAFFKLRDTTAVGSVDPVD